MSGLDSKYGDRLNVIWVVEVTAQGRAAKTLFDLPDRGIALLDRDNHLVWSARSSTWAKIEQHVRSVLD